MVVTAHLRIRHRGCITERLVEGARAAHISSDHDGDVLVVQGPEAVVGAFVAGLVAETPSSEVVSRTPGSAVVRGRTPPGGVVAEILRSACSILWPAVYADGVESYRVVAPSRARVDALVARLERHGDVTLEKIGDVTPDALGVSVPLADLAGGLTERQLSVLQRAIAAGYYEVPRRTSAVALAKSFGLSRSTLEEHLRKAERVVLARYGAVLASHPALAVPVARRAARAP